VASNRKKQHIELEEESRSNNSSIGTW